MNFPAAERLGTNPFEIRRKITRNTFVTIGFSAT
jgi:hypothetical protein